MSHGRVRLNPNTPTVRYDHGDVLFPLNFTQQLNPNPGIYIGDLHFTDCVFHEPVELGDYQCTGKVVFKNCTFQADVLIALFYNITIAEGCIFCQKLTIQEVAGQEEIGNFTVDGELQINNTGQKLKLSNINASIQKQTLRIFSQAKELSVNTCAFKGIYLKSTFSGKHSMAVHGCRADHVSFIAYYDECQMVVNESEVAKINCKGEDDSKHRVKLSYCKNVKGIILSMPKLRKTEIRYCDIEKMEIWETLDKLDSLTIEHSTITSLKFWHFINEGLISLRGVAIPAGGILGIIASNLGKTEFINCDFSKAILQFENSRLTEVFLAETDFPQRVELDKRENHRQAQLAFGQLRTAFDKQGDTVRALEYQAREIEAHYHDIQSFWRNRPPYLHFTKLNLGLNKLSNNFGRDWGRGLIFSIMIGLLCFIGLVFTTRQYSWHGHWTYDSRLIASFARFMNPLRFFDLEALFTQNSPRAYVTLTWGSYVMDFLGRVLVAYGYYQTIQAFRRFGRK